MSKHVVLGAGPVGATIASQLAGAGQSVRLLTRSGSGPEHPLIQRERADAADPATLDFTGAQAIYHCIHGSQYSAKVWSRELPARERNVLDAAGPVGAVVAFPESLYSYGPVNGPITETSPRNASTGKLGVRARLLRQRADHPTPVVSVAASDFFGPLVRVSHAGERLFPTVLAGRKMTVIGSLDEPHSFTYVPDYAAAIIRAAAHDVHWNTVLHAPTGPALTQRELITALARAAGVDVPRMAALPTGVLRAAGLVHGPSRELAETGYMFARPFVLDSTFSQRQLKLAPTPLPEALAATVEWWRSQP